MTNIKADSQLLQRDTVQPCIIGFAISDNFLYFGFSSLP